MLQQVPEFRHETMHATRELDCIGLLESWSMCLWYATFQRYTSQSSAYAYKSSTYVMLSFTPVNQLWWL